MGSELTSPGYRIKESSKTRPFEHYTNNQENFRVSNGWGNKTFRRCTTFYFVPFLALKESFKCILNVRHFFPSLKNVQATYDKQNKASL